MSSWANLDESAWMDATEQAELVRRGEVTATELAEAAIGRIERLNPALNAVVTPMFDRALADVRQGVPAGPFAGVPFLLKDLAVECAGVRFTLKGHPRREFEQEYLTTGAEYLVRSNPLVTGPEQDKSFE